MARVTPEEVKEICPSELSDTIIDMSIDLAGVLITQHLEGKGLTEAVLTKIELLLSAHFLTLNERQFTSRKIGEAQDNYAGTFAMGLDFSQYGQQAKLFDSTSTLVNLGKIKASFAVF